MLNEIPRRYIQTDLQIFIADIPQLNRLPLDRNDVQQSLIVQAISAIDGYPKEGYEKTIEETFKPFAFFKEPSGNGFLLGIIHGAWNQEGVSYEMRELLILEHYYTPEEVVHQINTIKRFNEDAHIVLSDSCADGISPLFDNPQA